MKTRPLFHWILEVKGDARQDVIYVPLTLILPGHAILKRRLEVGLQVLCRTAHEVHGPVRLFLALESVTETGPQKFPVLKEHVGLTSVREVFAFVDPRVIFIRFTPILVFLNIDGNIVIVENEDLSALYAGLRTKRNEILRECDWTQFNDSPLDVDTKESWAMYRKALRDLPKTAMDPTDISWPAPPS